MATETIAPRPDQAPTHYIINMHCGHTVEHDLTEIPLYDRNAHAEWLSKTIDCPTCTANGNKQLLEERKYKIAVGNQIAIGLAKIAGEGPDHMRATIIRDHIIFNALKHYQNELTEDQFKEKFVYPTRQFNSPQFWINNAGTRPEHLAELIESAVNDPNAHIAFTSEEIFGD